MPTALAQWPPRNMRGMMLALLLVLVLVLSPPSLGDASPRVQAGAADEHRAKGGRTSVLLLMADDLRPVSRLLPPTVHSSCRS